jgi:indolepyruvate ferredoxin oxidoreductase beta subunit
MGLDIVFTGIGGQGIVVISDIYCEAALLDGFDVAKAEIHGMAQRGGSITAHTRIGEKVLNPLIERGKSDIILGFEMLETARTLNMLKKMGTVVMNKRFIPPGTMLQGLAKPVKEDELMALIRERALHVYGIDGLTLANSLGNSLVMNTVLLGALSAIPENPVKKKSFEKAISERIKEKYIKVNLKAFQLGRERISLG